MGRPSSYNDDIAATICSELAEGKSLRTICKQDGMPDLKTIFNWLGHPDESFNKFRDLYAKAKQESADALTDEMLDIADDSTLDHNDRRIRVDTRKWLASKLKPKKYGDKIAVGGDENAGPIQVSWANGQ